MFKIRKLIVTNNKKLSCPDFNIVKVEGNFLDVLYKTRDLIHLGYKLISHPLGASMSIMHSPVRSILMSNHVGSIDEESLEIIESSIEKYKISMGERTIDARNINDYELIDYELLKSAIRENDFINSIIKNNNI